MKICICAANFKSDLIEAISLNIVSLAKNLSSTHGHEVALLVPGDGPSNLENTAALSWSSYAPEQNYASKWRIFKNLYLLRKHIKTHAMDYDIFHFHVGTPLELFLIWIFLPRLAMHRVATIWQPFLGFRECAQLFLKFKLSRPQITQHFIFNAWPLLPLFALGQTYFQRLIFPTDYQYSQAIYAGKSKKIVMANCVTDLYRTRHNTSPSNSEPLRVLYIGHATTVKGVNVLVRALKRAFDDGIDLRATVALSNYGDPTPILQLISSEGLHDLITIKGAVDIADEFGAHDVFVLPLLSTVGTTCIPNTLLEAFSAGIAVISSDIPTLREADPVAANIFFPPDDDRALTKGLKDLAENRIRMEKVRAHNRETYLNTYTLTLYTLNTANFYQTLSGLPTAHKNGIPL